MMEKYRAFTSKAKFFLVIVLLIAAIWVLLSRPNQSGETLKIDSIPVIPDGYTLVAAASYGDYVGMETLYCEENGTKRVYVCSDGTIGRRIPLPAGYRLIAVSQFGRFTPVTKYYCLDETAGIVIIFRP